MCNQQLVWFGRHSVWLGWTVCAIHCWLLPYEMVIGSLAGWWLLLQVGWWRFSGWFMIDFGTRLIMCVINGAGPLNLFIQLKGALAEVQEPMKVILINCSQSQCRFSSFILIYAEDLRFYWLSYRVRLDEATINITHCIYIGPKVVFKPEIVVKSYCHVADADCCMGDGCNRREGTRHTFSCVWLACHAIIIDLSDRYKVFHPERFVGL